MPRLRCVAPLMEDLGARLGATHQWRTAENLRSSEGMPARGSQTGTSYQTLAQPLHRILDYLARSMHEVWRV
jgi:hypothetical protein